MQSLVGQESVNTEVHFEMFFHETIICFFFIRIQDFALYFLSTKTDVRQMSGCRQAVIRQWSRNSQAVIKQLAGNCQAIRWKSSG